MYIPNPVPDGFHCAYILRDETTRWYKIGMSGDVELRRKKLCHEHYGSRSQDRIVEYYSWTFQHYFAALHVEQSAITILKNFGFQEVRSSDWFDLDESTIGILMEMVGDLARRIIQWEKIDGSMECDARRCDPPHGAHSPYGKYLRAEKIGESKLQRRSLDWMHRLIRARRTLDEH